MANMLVGKRRFDGITGRQNTRVKSTLAFPEYGTTCTYAIRLRVPGTCQNTDLEINNNHQRDIHRRGLFDGWQNHEPTTIPETELNHLNNNVMPKRWQAFKMPEMASTTKIMFRERCLRATGVSGVFATHPGPFDSTTQLNRALHHQCEHL